MKAPRVLTPRKILIASLGVATVTYACGGSSTSNVSEAIEAGKGDSSSAAGATSGNLMPPLGTGGGVNTAGMTSGNLMPPLGTGGTTVAVGGASSGNLMPPPGTGGTQINLGGASSGNLVPPPPVPSI